jgi:hypothetical protein
LMPSSGDRYSKLLAVSFFLLGLSSCGASSSPSPSSAPTPTTPSVLSQPMTLNVYPADSPNTGPRIFVMVTAVGSAQVNLPLILDTGSAGLTLNAFQVFPSTMVGSDGFRFAPGQTSIVYNGITVTNQVATRTYGGGGAETTTQTGNIGYATMTFGNAQGTLTTMQMPALFYYQITTEPAGTVLAPNAYQNGIFGINPNGGAAVVEGSSEPLGGYPACVSGVAGTCENVSPLKYLTYSNGLHAGYMLAPAPLQSCDILTAGSCQSTASLTIGLSATMEDGYNAASLTCPPPNYNGVDTINGYPVCIASQPNSAVTVSGPVSGSMIASVNFDTGTPGMVIRISTGSTFPASIPGDTDVLWQLPSGFSYSYTSDAGLYDTADYILPSGMSGTIGIGFFTTNYFFTDYTASITGWK